MLLRNATHVFSTYKLTKNEYRVAILKSDMLIVPRIEIISNTRTLKPAEFEFNIQGITRNLIGLKVFFNFYHNKIFLAFIEGEVTSIGEYGTDLAMERLSTLHQLSDGDENDKETLEVDWKNNSIKVNGIERLQTHEETY